MKIGYHASHEQFSPSELLDYVKQAESMGFKSILCSDHFHPWSVAQGHSGFAWSWLGAAMQATSLEFGIVNAPGQRYHPAIIAQAAATLAEMFPERFWIAIGSGQALNERITGSEWPAKDIRQDRLRESADIMRRLWDGETVTHRGHVHVLEATLYTRPEKLPALYGAALTIETARWVASWTDGLITVNQPLEKIREMVDAFKSQRPQARLAVKLQVSYAPSDESAEEMAWAEWRNNTLGSALQADLFRPEQFDEAGKLVGKRHVRDHVVVGSNAQTYVDTIKTYRDLGFQKIILHNVNKRQSDFISFMGREVLPKL